MGQNLMDEFVVVMLGGAAFALLVLGFDWLMKRRSPGRATHELTTVSRSAVIRELGMEAEGIVNRLQLPEEVKAQDIETIHSAVSDGLTDRKFWRHYMALLGYFVQFIGTHRAHVIETVIYTAMFVPDENPNADMPDNLTDEHFLLGEAFLDAFVDERLKVPAGEDGSPDRENGDCFYTLLNYALEHPEYGWMLLDIAIDYGISDLTAAESLLEQAKARGFDALLSSAR